MKTYKGTNISGELNVNMVLLWNNIQCTWTLFVIWVESWLKLYIAVNICCIQYWCPSFHWKRAMVFVDVA